MATDCRGSAPLQDHRFPLKTNNDFLTLRSGVLKSVTIGALADEASRRLIQDLVASHATGVLVRQATVASDRYELTISPPF